MKPDDWCWDRVWVWEINQNGKFISIFFMGDGVKDVIIDFGFDSCTLCNLPFDN